jgi:hypothetical protein
MVLAKRGFLVLRRSDDGPAPIRCDTESRRTCSPYRSEQKKATHQSSLRIRVPFLRLLMLLSERASIHSHN